MIAVDQVDTDGVLTRLECHLTQPLEDALARTIAVLAAARLDTVFTNSVALRRAIRVQRTLNWSADHCLLRRSLLGPLQWRKLTMVQRTWWTEQGRANINRVLTARAFKLGEIMQETSERPKLITLTFGSVADSWTSRGDISAFLDKLRRWSKTEGATVNYVWTTEIQKRVALHYHVVVTGLPFCPKALIQSWWPHGFIDVRSAAVSEAMSYVLKYVRKTTRGEDLQSNTRNLLHSLAGLRHHGCSRRISELPDLVPIWVQECCGSLGVDVGTVSWWQEPASDTCAVVWEDGTEIGFTLSQVDWTVAKLRTQIIEEAELWEQNRQKADQ